MNENYINNLIDNLNLSEKITLEDIPEIDLYMDQVIQLFERKFSNNVRNNEEKVLTKTMINNYAKGKLFMPIKNKKYSKENLILISLIYQLKGFLSIKDIKTTLHTMVERCESGDSNGLREMYDSYLSLYDIKIKEFESYIEKDIKDVQEELDKKNLSGEYEDKLLMILSIVTMSNMYRRLAEKIIDDL